MGSFIHLAFCINHDMYVVIRDEIDVALVVVQTEGITSLADVFPVAKFRKFNGSFVGVSSSG